MRWLAGPIAALAIVVIAWCVVAFVQWDLGWASDLPEWRASDRAMLVLNWGWPTVIIWFGLACWAASETTPAASSPDIDPVSNADETKRGS